MKIKHTLGLKRFCVPVWLLVLSGTLLLAAGCVTTPRNQADVFRAKDQERAARYEILEPVSIAMIEFFAAEQHTMLETFLDGVERRIDDPEELANYLATARELNEESRLSEDSGWQDFVARLQPEDELYMFEYQRRYYVDFGLLVIRDGEIVFRRVWESTRLEGPEFDRFEEPEFDRLSE